MQVALAEVYGKSGRPEEGLAIVEQWLARPERTTSAEFYRLKGELMLIKDSKSEAEAERCLRDAIGIARQQSAKWWELRASKSLARLLRDAGRRAEARTMLADIYRWFTEGSDTVDLKDAKALLDELSA